MWNTIHVSTNLNYTKKVEDILKNEGFLIKMRDLSSDDGEVVYELQVLDHEAKDAHNFILENCI